MIFAWLDWHIASLKRSNWQDIPTKKADRLD
nr:MAG TPA: hypothetical protein [Bacteriophage sp.]